MKLAAVLLALALAGTATAAEQRGDWRQVVTDHDRQRLRDWRSAWMTALAEARSDGGAAAIAADPWFFAPDAALVDGALPPAGDYRCRHVLLGRRAGGTGLTIEPWARCRITGEGAPLRFVGLDGVQRPAGLVYPDNDRRGVFLGTTMFPDEHRPAAYAHAAGRDMAGVVERIGQRRWRLVLPWPNFGGALDLIELVPA